MLDEKEFAEIYKLYRDGLFATKEFREKWAVPLEGVPREEFFKPMIDRYEQLTGMNETNPNAILHHCLSLYGPACKRCGKPLRTPQAKLCGACMFPLGE